MGTVIPPGSWDATQPPRGLGDDTTPPGAHLPDPIGRFGGLYPRWPLLAAILLLPCILVGYGLDQYYQTRTCPMGFLCSMDVWPAPVQVMLIWAGFGLLWLLMLLVGVSQGVEANEATRRQHFLGESLRAISDFRTIRPLMGILGILISMVFLWTWLHQRLNASLVAFSVIFIFVAADVFFYPQQRRRPHTAQEQINADTARAHGFLGVLRSIPPFRWLIPNRARNNAPPTS